MFHIGQQVEIVNHSEPSCNGYYGVIEDIQTVGSTIFYHVQLETPYAQVCVCTVDELMEG
jgi:hypothetical protein